MQNVLSTWTSSLLNLHDKIHKDAIVSDCVSRTRMQPIQNRVEMIQETIQIQENNHDTETASDSGCENTTEVKDIYLGIKLDQTPF